MKRKLIALALTLLMVFSSVATLAAVPNEGQVIYVSPEGSDLNEGTFEKPLKSLKAAKEMAATLNNNQPITVVFRGGFYYQSEEVVFTPKDSGTEQFPIRYIAYEGERPVFTSAVKLDEKNFEVVTDEAILAKLPEESRGYVLQMDLKKLGIFAPDVIYDEKGEFAANWIDLYLDSKTQQTAEWPNGIQNYDHYSKPLAAGSTSKTSKDGGTFEVSTPRIFRWVDADPDQAMTFGYFGNDYTYAANLIKSVDPEKMSVTHVYGTSYGVKSTNSRRYKVVNLIEELDIPTEFYLDRKTETLYYYPPYDLEGKDLRLSINNSFPLIAAEGLSYVNFENLEFYGMHHGMSFANSHHINILGCTFFGSRSRMIEFVSDTNRMVGGQRLIGLGAYAWTSGCHDFIIDSCNFYDGNVGMINTRLGDNAYLEKSNSYIRNCFFERSSLVNGNAATVSMEESCGVNFVNNSMHNLFFHAVNFNGSYNNIQYNEIYNATRDPHDAGVIYSWRDFAERANDIAYNIIHDTDNTGERSPSSGTVAIYSDGEMSGNDIHHNILWNNGNPIHHNAGVTNNVSYNMMMRARRKGMAFTYLNYVYSADLRAEAIPLLVDIAPWWLEEFPELEYEIYHAKNIKQGSHNTTINNNISDSKDGSSAAGLATLKEYNNNVIIDPTKDTSMFVDYDNHDYRLKADHEFAKDFPDALTDKNFDYAMTGVQITDYRKTLPYFNEETSPFRTVHPRDGQTGIHSNEVSLYWEVARGADKYKVTIAKDKEMKDVVASLVCENTFLEKYTLEDNTTYYWTVEAENISVNSPSKWKTVSGVKSFTTGKPLANKVLAENAINVMLDDVDKVVEGTTEGTYPAGTKQRMLDAVATAREKLKKEDITQAEVDEIQEELEEVHADVGTSMYIKTVGVDDVLKMPWYGLGVISWGTDNPMPVEYDEKTGILKMTSVVDNQTAITSQNLSDKVVRKYKMRINWNGANTWMIFGEKVLYNLENDPYFQKDQRNAETAGYGWGSYAIVVTGGQGHLEFHARHRKGAQVMDTITNTYIKDGEWFDIEMGAITTLTGDRYIVRLNGKEVYNKALDSHVLGAPGKFYVSLPKKGMTVELQNPEGFTESEVYRMVPASDTVEAGKELKVFDITDKKDANMWRAGTTEVEVVDGAVRAKPMEQAAKHSLYYNAEQVYNSIVNFDTNFTGLTHTNPYVVSMRAADPNGDFISKGNPNYYFYILPSYMYVFAMGNNASTMIAKVRNNGVYKANERANVQVATVDCDGGTRVVCEINGTRLVDMIDGNSVKEPGYLVFWNEQGKEVEVLAPSKPAINLNDKIYTKPYVEKGDLVVTANDATKSSGEWSTYGVGVNTTTVPGHKQKEGPAAVVYELKANVDTYDVYYWNGITYTGDENVKVTIISPYDGEDKVYTISNRWGTAGWMYLGAVTSTDAVIRARVEGSGTGELLSGGFKLVKAHNDDQQLSRLLYENSGAIALKVGSDLAFVNEQPKYLSTPPVVVNGRTLVPIRFISEAFGATVKWDDATSSATIKADGHTLVFKQDAKTYTVDGKEKQLEQAATVVNGRMMLPIRVISEDLGKNVYWEESGSGFILINDKEIVTKGLEANIKAAINYYLNLKED